MVEGKGGNGSSNDIMTWAAKVGTVVPESEWKDSTTSTTNTTNGAATLQATDTATTAISDEQASDSKDQQAGGFGGGGNSGQLYDLKAYADSTVKN